MNHEQAKKYALICSLEHHLCNVDELFDQGYDGETILLLVEKYDADKWTAGYLPLVWEPYERHNALDLYNSIRDLSDVYSRQFANVLDA